MAEGDGQFLNEGEYADLPAESRQALSKYATPRAIADGCVAHMKVLGRPFKLPESMDALDDGQRAEFKAKMNALNGVPATMEGYEFTHGDGVEVHAETEAAFKQFAFENDVSPATAQKLVDFWNGTQTRAKAGQAEKIAERNKTGLKTMKDRGWTDGDMKNVQLLLTTYSTHDPDSAEGKAELQALADDMDATGNGSNPHLLLALKQMYADLKAEGKTFESAEAKGAPKGGSAYSSMK